MSGLGGTNQKWLGGSDCKSEPWRGVNPRGRPLVLDRVRGPGRDHGTLGAQALAWASCTTLLPPSKRLAVSGASGVISGDELGGSVKRPVNGAIVEEDKVLDGGAVFGRGAVVEDLGGD